MPDLSRIHALIAEFELDLSGATVITECATGAYSLTGPIAALAGADSVLCLGRDSDFGSIEVAQSETRSAAALLGVEDQVKMVSRSDLSSMQIEGPDVLVTNLYGVRPIDDAFAARMPEGAVIAAMCEYWELRRSDVDVEACLGRGLRIISTDEGHPLLRTIELVGLLAIHLLLECGAPFASGNVAIIGEGPFSRAVKGALTPWVRSLRLISSDEQFLGLVDQLECLDALVVADHEAALTGSPAWHEVTQVAASLGTHIVNVSGFPWGRLAHDISVWPPRTVPPRTMSRSLDAIGNWPVLRLHAAGLKVGALALRNELRPSGHRRGLTDPSVQALVEKVMQ